MHKDKVAAHTHQKAVLDAKSYKPQALQTANTIQAQEVHAGSFTKRNCRKGQMICRGSFGVAKEHERGSVIN